MYLLALTGIVVVRLKNEEATMLDKFGDKYRTYMRQTGRFLYPFKKPGEISEVCVEQENALDSNFGNFLPQNIEMIRANL
jgi:hypothetical protein